MCKELFMLWMIVSQTFRYSMQPKFSALIIIQATIVQITNIKLWLEKILLKFQYTEEESDMRKRELLEYTKTIQHECENKTTFKAWCICGSNLERHTNWRKLMQLWHKVILNPSSIAICERGFPKQNAIKSHLHNRLNLKTLDALYAGLSFWAWNGCNWLGYHLQHLKKHVRPKDT